jgi:inner membrane transporter RhtA
VTTTRDGRAALTDHVPAWSLAVVAIVSVQLGAALSIRLFAQVGPAGSAWLRLLAGGLIFLAIARPSLRDYTLRELRTPILLGVVTGIMTVCFLEAIDRIPLGTTVAIEFLGPLGVGVLRSPSRRTAVWPLLAFTGVLALTQPWTGDIDVVGVGYALAAATGWGVYIVMTQHVGDRFAGIQSLAISIPVGALTATVVGLPQAWGHITPQVVLASAGLALLMPVIPYTLELLALRRLTASAFGTLMALEPAVGTLWGILLLSQVPDGLQVVGVALVVAAGIGAERAGHRDPAEHAQFDTPGTA